MSFPVSGEKEVARSGRKKGEKKTTAVSWPLSEEEETDYRFRREKTFERWR